jgi:uncharacterized protein
MGDRSIRISLCYSPAPRVVHEMAMRLPVGSTVQDALALLPAQAVWAHGLAIDGLRIAIWNERVETTRVLQEDDRLELLRPLRVDPKVARRERFQKQGARSAGLFAKRRPGAKPGY